MISQRASEIKSDIDDMVLNYTKQLNNLTHQISVLRDELKAKNTETKTLTDRNAYLEFCATRYERAKASIAFASFSIGMIAGIIFYVLFFTG